MTIPNDARTRVKGIFEPIALAMGRAGLTPDALTVIGFAITVIGALLVSQQQWVVGGLVVFLGGAFDMFDGTLARATGKVSKLGAFMDSVFDRAGEVVVYLGVVAGLLALGVADLAFLAAAAMGSAVMVSYTRAKAEGLGFTPGSRMAAIGVMPREVRLVLLSVGLIVAGSIGMDPCECGAPWPVTSGSSVSTMGGAALFLALAMITIGSIVTTTQRILHVRSQARQQASSQPTETNT